MTKKIKLEGMTEQELQELISEAGQRMYELQNEAISHLEQKREGLKEAKKKLNELIGSPDVNDVSTLHGIVELDMDSIDAMPSVPIMLLATTVLSVAETIRDMIDVMGE